MCSIVLIAGGQMRLLRATNTLFFLLLLFPFSHSDAYPFSWEQTELHHIFPQTYAGWFRKRDIDPNLWCIPLSREKHTGAMTSIHHMKYSISGGKDFNGSWQKFIDLHPNATKDQCFAYATVLLGEFGIRLKSQTFYNYLTKQASNVKIPKSKLVEKSSKFVSKFMKWGGRLIELSWFVVAAWEIYDLGSAFDVNIDEEKFDKAMDAYAQGKELLHDGKPEDARFKFLIANYLLGSMFHKEIMKRTNDVYAEIASNFDTDRQREALRLGMSFLKNAYKIKSELQIVFPQVPLYLGEILAITGERSRAIPYLREAEEELAYKGETKIATHVKELISILNKM